MISKQDKLEAKKFRADRKRRKLKKYKQGVHFNDKQKTTNWKAVEQCGNIAYGRKNQSEIEFQNTGNRDHETNSSYQKWRKACLKRDNYQCTECKSNKTLHVHHVLEWGISKENRFKVFNGITLCKNCHQKQHKFRLYKKDKTKQEDNNNGGLALKVATR